MYTNAFLKNNERRPKPDEVLAWCAEKFDITPIEGFARFSKSSEYHESSGRIISFTELPNTQLQSRYIHQNVNGYLRWKTKKIDSIRSSKVAFLFAMGFGNGSPLPQPTGEFALYFDDIYLLSIHGVKHSWSWRRGDVSFHFSANRIEATPPNSSLYLTPHIPQEMWAAFGPGAVCLPTYMVKPEESHTIKVVPINRVKSNRWFQVTANKNIIGRTDFVSCLESAVKPRHASIDGYNIYYGDIHTHSGESVHSSEGCGVGTIDENYRYARDVCGLDIYALTDHEFQMNPEYVEYYMKKADTYNEQGKFVTLPAYEFTNFMWGHRNVYYRNSGGKVISAHRDWIPRYWDESNQLTPYELWNKLDELGISAITIPHHPSATSHPLTWDVLNPKYDRLVEVYSCWGSSEYYGDYPRGVSDRYRGLFVRDALNSGYRLGLMASSDGHDGHPGNAQSPYHKHHHIFHPLGSGWIAVLSSKLERNTVFDAMYNRHCYATTGVPILMNFTANENIMGSEIKVSNGDDVRFNLSVKGSNGIDHIRIIKNGKIEKSFPVYGEWDFDLQWSEIKTEESLTDFYYVRVVQKDMESAWSSPIWVESG